LCLPVMGVGMQPRSCSAAPLLHLVDDNGAHAPRHDC
jgi:hypothetical protein